MLQYYKLTKEDCILASSHQTPKLIIDVINKILFLFVTLRNYNDLSNLGSFWHEISHSLNRKPNFILNIVIQNFQSDN